MHKKTLCTSDQIMAFFFRNHLKDISFEANRQQVVADVGQNRIATALRMLVKHGFITCVGGRPRRYAITPEGIKYSEATFLYRVEDMP